MIGPIRPQRGDLPQQFAHRLGVDDRGVGHGDQFVRHRVPRPQNVESLTTRSRTDEDPRERPQAAHERPEHEMGRVDEEHVTLARRCGVQARLQFGFEKLGLGFDVLGQAFFGRHGDHADALELQAQILEELPHLAGTASQSGQLKNPFARLGYGVDGLFLEGFANQLAIGRHFALRAIGVPSSQTVQPAVTKRGHIPLDGGSSNPDDLGRLLACDSVVQQAKVRASFHEFARWDARSALR